MKKGAVLLVVSLLLLPVTVLSHGDDVEIVEVAPTTSVAVHTEISYVEKGRVFLISILQTILDFLSPSSQLDSVEIEDEMTTVTLRTAAIAELSPHPHDTVDDSVTDEGHGISIFSEEYVIEEDVWLVGYQVAVHNAPVETLHHVLVVEPTKPASMCTSGPVNRHSFVAIGSNDSSRSPIVFPKEYGDFIEKGSKLVLEAMIHNALPPYGPGELYENVYVTVDLYFEDPSTSDRSTKIDFYTLILHEDMPCGEGDTFLVPASDSLYEKKSEEIGIDDGAQYTFPTSGTIVSLGSHMHAWEGGKYLEVYVNDERIGQFSQHLSTEEPWSWISPRSYVYKHVEEGDTIHVSATYENTTDRPIRGAMGILGFYFAPD